MCTALAEARRAIGHGDVPIGAVVLDSAGNLVGTTYTTGSGGHACVTGLTIGASYTVTETTAPTNYSVDANSPADIDLKQTAASPAGTGPH